MLYFKAPDNSVHALDDEQFMNLLPEGSIQITKTEADVLSTPVPTATQIKASIEAAIQLRLDTFAQTGGYDSILSACTYATSSVPKFKAEGQRAVDLRDQTWATAGLILTNVESGLRPMPTSFTDIEPELPALTWTV